MLPTALLMELYDHQITNEDFERMLVVPDGNDNSYDPYKPIRKSSPIFITSAERGSPTRGPGSIMNETIALLKYENASPQEDNFSSSSSTVTAPGSPTNGSVSYWQDLEIYSGSSDEESRPKSSLSWTSLDNNIKSGKNNTKPTFGRSKSYDVKSKYCSFCFHNREKENVYTSHALRDDANNITCPALFEVVCRYCGATGTEAHTPKYCPNRTFNTRHSMS